MKEAKEIKGKIILLGKSEVGKTSIINRYMDGKFSTTVASTMAVDFRLKKLEYQEYIMKMEIWDTAGQERFKTINKSYYKNSFGAIIVFDLTKSESFDDIQYYLRETRNHSEKNDKFLRVIVGNKLDICEEDPKNREVFQEEIQKKIQEFNNENNDNIIYFETSAKTGTNINECFDIFFQQLKKKCGINPDEASKKNRNHSLKKDEINQKSKQKKDGCC